MNTDTHVEIKVNGKTVKQYNHNGSTYIEARAGTEYSIRIQNDNWKRMLAVITVDGINVITGQPQGDLIGRGYIVNARSSIDIKGFRKDSDTVGAFKFCKKGASYCNESGLKGNNGVIGIRLYEEKIAPVIIYRSLDNGKSIPPYKVQPDIFCRSIPNNDNSSTSSNSVYSSNIECKCMTSNTTPNFDLGTTWGQKLDESVKTVEFEAESFIHAEHIIYYDTKSNLEGMGISFKEEKQINVPKAFGVYAQPPKGWKGK